MTKCKKEPSVVKTPCEEPLPFADVFLMIKTTKARSCMVSSDMADVNFLPSMSAGSPMASSASNAILARMAIADVNVSLLRCLLQRLDAIFL